MLSIPKHFHLPWDHDNNLLRRLLFAYDTQGARLDSNPCSSHVRPCLRGGCRTQRLCRFPLRLPEKEVRGSHGRLPLGHRRVCDTSQRKDRFSRREVLCRVSHHWWRIFGSNHRHSLVEQQHGGSL